jgi:hypothetical protein
MTNRQWEYLVVEIQPMFGNGAQNAARLNSIGRQGWELVMVLQEQYGEAQQLTSFYLFKRPFEIGAGGPVIGRAQ